MFFVFGFVLIPTNLSTIFNPEIKHLSNIDA